MSNHPWAAERWLIFYDDGSTFSSAEGSPESAPIDGVQVIVMWLHNGTKKVLNKGDFYLWSGEIWLPLSHAELELQLRKLLPQLKFGRWTNPSVFYSILNKATQLEG